MWWMRRVGRAGLGGRAVRWGLLVFVGLAVLGHFEPDPQGVARPPAVEGAAVEGAVKPVTPRQAHHLLHAHVPHRLPWWLHGGYGYGGQPPPRDGEAA